MDLTIHGANAHRDTVSAAVRYAVTPGNLEYNKRSEKALLIAENTAEMLGRLIEKLANKGLLTQDEVVEVIRHYNVGGT